MSLRRIVNALRHRVWDVFRARLNRLNRARFQGKNVCVVSMNCTGGILYHELGLPFLSPTINLFFQAEDFIRFCERLDEYLDIDELIECFDPDVVQDCPYPVALLGDVKLFLVHYRSVSEAQDAWNRRKKRVRKEDIVILATDRDGMTDSLKDRFEQLPYPKVMFVHKPDSNHPSCFYLRGYEEESSVGIITEPIGWFGARKVDQFDWVAFFNGAHEPQESPS